MSSVQAPSVSIISVNFNNTKVTLELLSSLEHLTYPNWEIIVVDNGSREDASVEIRSAFPKTKVLRSDANLGFAGGNNLALPVATGDYILYLNNDTEVEPNFIEPLVHFFQANDDAGVVSPKIIYFNSGGMIQYAGSTTINPYTGRNARRGYLEKNSGQYEETVETGLAHGAAMMIPRRVINEVGPMPEEFFLYYEEIDWCESIKKKGYKIYCVPSSVIYHKESQSVGKGSPMKTYYLTRNRLLYQRRQTVGIEKLSWVLFFMFISIPKNSIQYILKKEWQHLSAFWKGVWWNVMHKNISFSAKANEFNPN